VLVAVLELLLFPQAVSPFTIETPNNNDANFFIIKILSFLFVPDTLILLKIFELVQCKV
jgi:hypothetical protein